MIDSFDEYYKFTFRLCEALKFSPDCAVRAGRVRRERSFLDSAPVTLLTPPRAGPSAERVGALARD